METTKSTRPTRRGFLGLMAAAPVAGRQMAEKVLVQTGHSVFGVGAARTLNEVGVSIAEGKYSPPNSSLLKKLAAKFALAGKLPEFKEQEIEIRAAEFTGLDPDLASCVSMSVSHKLSVQRKRNIKRLRAQALSNLYLDTERQEFSAKMANKYGHHFHWY